MKRRFAILLVLTACLIGFARAEIPMDFISRRNIRITITPIRIRAGALPAARKARISSHFGKPVSAKIRPMCRRICAWTLPICSKKRRRSIRRTISLCMGDALPFGRKIQIYLDVYFIVLGAPEEYVCHIWDNDESTDAQMPFEIQIEYEG